jgi:hypothetical protein
MDNSHNKRKQIIVCICVCVCARVCARVHVRVGGGGRLVIVGSSSGNFGVLSLHRKKQNI